MRRTAKRTPLFVVRFSEFWPTAHRVFKRAFHAIDSLHRALFVLLNPPQVEGHNKVIRHLGILNLCAIREIAILVVNGCGPGAMKILRGLLENSINVEYLRQDPSKVDDYLEWEAVDTWRYLGKWPQVFGGVGGKVLDEARVRHSAVRQRFERRTRTGSTKPRDNWCSLSLADRADMTHFREVYRMLYPAGSRLLHTSVTAAGYYMQPRGGSSQVRAEYNVPPSLEWCDIALSFAHLCGARTARTLSLAFGFESDPPIANLIRDYNRIWRQPPCY